MSRYAILGLGAMGRRMAERLLDADHEVTVWNRTTGRADDLAGRGARVAATPAEAVAGADFALSMVRDDAASRAVWLDATGGALAQLGPDAVAIESSTLSTPYVETLAAAFDQAGRAFIDAPVAGSRPQAEAGQLIFFAGGDADVVERVRPALEPLAGAVHHAGTNGAGAAVKLMVNALFGLQLGVLAELIGFARNAGIDAELAVEIIGQTPVCGPAAKAAAGAMLAGAWAPAFPIDLVAKDFALVEASAEAVDADVPLTAAARAVYADAAAAGLADDNITGIVQRYVGAAR